MLAEKVKEKLFAAIQRTMENEGISQGEVARRIGAERPNINRLMRGKIPVSVDFLLKIAESIGLDVDLKIRLKK